MIDANLSIKKPQCGCIAKKQKVHMSCQHLEFCNTKSDSTYPLAILILQD